MNYFTGSVSSSHLVNLTVRAAAHNGARDRVVRMKTPCFGDGGRTPQRWVRRFLEDGYVWKFNRFTHHHSYNTTADDHDVDFNTIAGSGSFLLHHRVQTGSGAHPASYPMGTRGSFPPGREADHSPPSNAKVKEWVELYLHSPSMPSQRGAQLKHRDNFTFYKDANFIAFKHVYVRLHGMVLG
jgi:hypothetical protein